MKIGKPLDLAVIEHSNATAALRAGLDTGTPVKLETDSYGAAGKLVTLEADSYEAAGKPVVLEIDSFAAAGKPV